MIVTRVTGEIVNITVDFSKLTGSIDKKGHPVFTTEGQIDEFINGEQGIELEPNQLDVRANDLIIETQKSDENITTILI